MSEETPQVPMQKVGKVLPPRAPLPPPEPPVEHQFKVKLPDDVLLRLHHQADALGFHTENALSTVALKAFSKVPAAKVWQVLALIESYAQGPTGRRRR